MTELEILSALLEAAAKRQMEADEAYHKAAEEVESIKAEMVRVKNKREKELDAVGELLCKGRTARKELQKICDVAYGNEAKIKISVYLPASELNDTDFQLYL
jgi:hypothetical protein|nr:MAG TPA: hypothetical protein [Caudoviricetes sp.]DAO52885.1 MAG TPA: hypothetical protein [Caudoviricetes sp.]